MSDERRNFKLDEVNFKKKCWAKSAGKWNTDYGIEVNEVDLRSEFGKLTI